VRRYVDAVTAEVRRAPARFRGQPRQARVDTIFFGGGTPSLLDAADVARILDACRAAFDVTVRRRGDARGEPGVGGRPLPGRHPGRPASTG